MGYPLISSSFSPVLFSLLSLGNFIIVKSEPYQQPETVLRDSLVNWISVHGSLLPLSSRVLSLWTVQDSSPQQLRYEFSNWTQNTTTPWWCVQNELDRDAYFFCLFSMGWLKIKLALSHQFKARCYSVFFPSWLQMPQMLLLVFWKVNEIFKQECVHWGLSFTVIFICYIRWIPCFSTTPKSRIYVCAGSFVGRAFP